MPLYAVLIHTPVDGAWAHSADPTEMRAAHDRHAEQMTSSGAMVAALPLLPADTAVTLRADGDTPGPFRPGEHELIGIAVIRAEDDDRARELARLNPALVQGGAVEVRRVEDSWFLG